MIEAILYYVVILAPVVADYAMFGSLGVYFLIAWKIKPKVLTLVYVIVLLMVYGVASFFVGYPIYHVGYPLIFEEFLPVIGIKTMFNTLPLIFALALKKK